METRPHQNFSRAKEEQWLIDAIDEHDVYGAEFVIRMIKDKPPTGDLSASLPQLHHLDDDGNSFIFLSIANQVNSITALLFDALKDNDKIILGKNKKNQTLLWIAAQSQDKDMLKNLLPKAILYYQKELLDEKLWFLRDKDGNTPLHVAISPGTKVETIEYLLSTLQKYESSENLTFQLNNLTNKNGDTPLHIAFKMKNIHAIAILTQYGADWTVVNNKKKSSFDYFCTYTLKFQQMLIPLLAVEKIVNNQSIIDRTYQNCVLNLYQKNLSHSKLNLSHENYVNLASLVSLKNLIIANITTNELIKKNFLEASVDKNIPLHDDDIQIEIEEKETNDQMDKINNEVVINIDPALSLSSLSVIKQKNLDRQELTDFINKIDAYITDLENNPRPSMVLPLCITLVMINWLIFWGTETWMICEHQRAHDMTGCKDPYYSETMCRDSNHPAYWANQSKTDTQLIFFSIFYGIFSLGISILLPSTTWNLEGFISQNEWKDLSIFIEKLIIKLQNLPNNQLSPEHDATIIQLQTASKELKNYLSRKTVLDIFKRLVEPLKKVRENLNLGYYNSGLVLFAPPKKLDLLSNHDLNHENDSESDKTPLLIKYSAQ